MQKYCCYPRNKHFENFIPDNNVYQILVCTQQLQGELIKNEDSDSGGLGT